MDMEKYVHVWYKRGVTLIDSLCFYDITSFDKNDDLGPINRLFLIPRQ